MLLFGAWKKFPKQYQKEILRRIKLLGIQPIKIKHGSNKYYALNLDRCYLKYIRFSKNQLFFTEECDVQDLVHDVGHAMVRSPSDRARFNQLFGDFASTKYAPEVDETRAMVFQWALSRGLGEYSVWQTLVEGAYGFADDNDGSAWGDNAGKQWQDRLEEARPTKLEKRAFNQAVEYGLISLPKQNKRFEKTL